MHPKEKFFHCSGRTGPRFPHCQQSLALRLHGTSFFSAGLCPWVPGMLSSFRDRQTCALFRGINDSKQLPGQGFLPAKGHHGESTVQDIVSDE